MNLYLAPGLYHERTDSGPPAVGPVPTDVAAFVGIARQGPVDTPVPIESFRQFQGWFGDFAGAGYLAYAVRAFFENGGRRCWVVRVASRDPAGGARAASMMLYDRLARPVWRLEASSPGASGNSLRVHLAAVYPAQTRAEAGAHDPRGASVDSVSGFARAVLVRLIQPGSPEAWRVLSHVDPVAGRLWWMHPDRNFRLPSDREVSGFDPDRPVSIESLEYELRVRSAAGLRGFFRGLSLVSAHDGYGPRALAPVQPPQEAEADTLVSSAPAPVVLWAMGEDGALPSPLELPLGWLPLEGGADGLAALDPYDYTGAPLSPLDSDTARRHKCRGLRALEAVQEVSVVAVPDIHIRPHAPSHVTVEPKPADPCLPGSRPQPEALAPPAGELPPVFGEEQIYRVQAALVAQCERLRDRVALLDPPHRAAHDDALGIGAVRAWRSGFETSYAAFYYPWVRVVDPLRTPAALTRDIPPSGHVAGAYARTDLAGGVHLAPANGPLAWIQDLTVRLDEAAHGVLNPVGINAIRALPGRGLRIYGARTLSSDPQWRYVNVRRLLIMIEQAVARSLQWAVFEPNDVLTRTKLRLVLASFLIALWQQGALAGATMGEAFFVQCDADNNPPQEVEAGRLFVDIGVAPLRPFEFVVIRVGRLGNAFEVLEAGGRS